MTIRAVHRYDFRLIELFFECSSCYVKHLLEPIWLTSLTMEVVYVTIGNAACYLSLYLTSIQFQGELQTGGHVGGQKSNADQSELDK